MTCALVALSTLCCWFAPAAFAQEKPQLPHAYTEPPGPPISADEAAAKMTVPPGFKVEVVAHEPDIVNPVAMTFDERGRIWITESVEYPRHEAGPGRDRIKILEDTDGDGRADKFTIFAEGLNIPSGIAVGAGGVWVGNAPHILFMQDTDGDDRADKTEVVVTGFGRADTHEGPNSLTWGPDGWLYGLNGVFNPTHIEYRGKTYDFTCAMWRIHPRTRDFEVFCEGTSNPWGIAFNNDGDAFVSACVIDHLWHLVETGYYHRQAGAYPPFTWKIESIVDHKHQKAAYCGIHWFDSDAYPPEYREKLYMGNIHGNAINCDRLERNGSTYKGHAEPDFLQANDVWFMPIVQKTGPDGCLYILDWYDQYHCYQDARRVPEALDRSKGRLYRVRYNDTPRAPKFDLAQESDDELIERLKSPNIFFRDIAQRLLWERKKPETMKKLEGLALDKSLPRKARMHALWARVGCGPLDQRFHTAVYLDPDASFQAWSLRAAGIHRQRDGFTLQHVSSVANEEFRRSEPQTMLQAAVTTGKLETGAHINLLEIASRCGDDPLIPHIVWNNLQPLIEDQGHEIATYLSGMGPTKSPALIELAPRIVDRMLASKQMSADDVALLLEALFQESVPFPTLGRCLGMVSAKIQGQELSPAQCDALRPKFEPILSGAMDSSGRTETYVQAALLATSLRLPAGFDASRNMLASSESTPEIRVQALAALVTAEDEGVIDTVRPMLEDAKTSTNLRRSVIEALGRFESPKVGELIVGVYDQLPADVKPQAIELLTQRPAWACALLTAIADKKIPADAVNLNQVRGLAASKDETVAKQVTAIWGNVRSDRNPGREQVIVQMRRFFREHPGDARRGQELYGKLCGQCHKIHGQGQEVGPDITLNGRASFDQLLSNVFDPSLVIGNAYQARVVITDDGRTLTGLVVEDSPQRVVLKVQGGKLETIARDHIDEMETSKLSLMPEGVEKQYKPEELADLFAFLTLDKPPDDPNARPIPGALRPKPTETTDPSQYNNLLAEVAPRFTLDGSGHKGVALLSSYRGRDWVVRTHPIDRKAPCILRSHVAVPEGQKTELVMDVAYDKGGDWNLVVRADGEKLLSKIIGPKSSPGAWSEVKVDLSHFAGKTIELEILNEANGWSYEFAYWGRVEVVSQ
jgi:putative membrane-bound dehydrogenase-like protein